MPFICNVYVGCAAAAARRLRRRRVRAARRRAMRFVLAMLEVEVNIKR